MCTQNGNCGHPSEASEQVKEGYGHFQSLGWRTKASEGQPPSAKKGIRSLCRPGGLVL